ncbi:MAG: serine hydrolase [Patescibacteria group bacterium]
MNSDTTCGFHVVIDKKGYKDLRSKLMGQIEDYKKQGKVGLVSIWFRDLKYGPTLGINERVDFIPASLLKLPMAITYLDLSEDYSEVLNKTVKYSNPNPALPVQIFVPSKKVEKNGIYSIKELIEYMIVYSDNNAAQLLFEYLNTKYPEQNLLANTLRDLGVLGSGSDLYLSAVNTKEYASIFRLLYNSSYLSRENSEELLSMLADSEFKEGLNAGVPENIIVSHKFGERVLDNGERQLHDCGIVYYPENPYQLCIMTRGTDYDDLKSVIQEISKEIYTEFDSRKIE